MPIVKTTGKLIFYAHVPKCGGSSVAKYLRDRFGTLAFSDNMFLHASPPEERWSKTSPQHIDAASLSKLFPAGFFDATFSIVRHPVARMISAYHFQKEVERSVPANTGFSEWLLDLAEHLEQDRFAFDNHIRPMSEIVPADAMVFYMEHGLDALIPWFDTVTGVNTGPRQLDAVNKRGDINGASGEKAQPSDADLDLIGKIYASDFKRFSYRIGEKAPGVSAPVLPADFARGDLSRKTLGRRGSVLTAALTTLRRAR